MDAQDFIRNALVAITIGFMMLVILVPLIAVVLFSLLDILSRRDISYAKLVWLGAIFLLPVLGMLLYWVTRPKNFDPWVDDGPVQLGGYRVADLEAPAVALAAPASIEGHRTTAAEADPDSDIPRAA